MNNTALKKTNKPTIDADLETVKRVRRWLDSRKEREIDMRDLRRVCYLAEQQCEHAALRKRIDEHLEGGSPLGCSVLTPEDL